MHTTAHACTCTCTCSSHVHVRTLNIHRTFNRYTNTELVMKYAHWALERDEVLATKIFTERVEEGGDSEGLSPHRVLDYLKSFPVATVSYLEHIIRNKGSQVRVCSYE